MRKFKTKEEAYGSCTDEGYFRKISYINKQKIRALLKNITTNINSAKKLAQSLPEKDEGWMNVYTMHYEAVRIGAEALLIFDKNMSQNHQCLFAGLCVKHPELNFDWDFFEKIRTKRNGVNYYGEQVSYDEWKTAESEFKLTISILKKEIEKKLGNSSK